MNSQILTLKERVIIQKNNRIKKIRINRVKRI
jgi:hypothetical protein